MVYNLCVANSGDSSEQISPAKCCFIRPLNFHNHTSGDSSKHQPIMDSFCVYKDKLKEALTLIPTMSHPKKLEAVSYWNDAATYFQNIVNPSTSQEEDEQRKQQQEQQQQRDQSGAQDFETNVDTGLDATLVPGAIVEADQPSANNVVSMGIAGELDIDHQGRQFDIDSILNDPQYGLQPETVDKTGQVQSNVITEEINPSSMSRLAITMSNQHIDNNDTSTESGQDVSLTSFPLPIDACGQQAARNLSNRHFMLPSNNSSASSSRDQTDDLNDSMSNQLQQQDCCSSSDQIGSANATSDFLIENLLATTSYTAGYNGSIQNDMNCTTDNEIGQFDRGPELAELDSASLEGSPISFGDTSATSSCMNSNSLGSLHICASSSENTGEFSFSGTVDNQSEQQAEFDPRQSQFAAASGTSQFSTILSTEIVNYESNLPPQTTVTPANIDSSSCEKSDKSLHKCDTCGKSGFSTKGNLKRHQKAHSGEKPFKCDHCDARFTEKKSLKIHIRKHTGEKPYKCEVCHQLFAQTAVLKSHMMSLHVKERKFVCHKCDKTFKQSSQLKLHIMRHDGIKKLSCSNCQARFLTKGDLERHFRVHTGERPYVCKLCGKAFTRQQSLNEHLNRHYGKKPFTCKHCGRQFSEMSACYKHMKMHSENEQQVMQT